MATVDQRAVKRQLMAEGFGLMSPPKGGAMYVRGDDYRTANGESCDAPVIDEPTADQVLDGKLSARVADMTISEKMRLIMGDTIDHNTMRDIMGNSSAGDVLKDYTDAAISKYLKAQDVDVAKGAKLPALLQLVEALHA
ncbi:hypothetical protein [uncultured Paraglaciecola sp.]|uniref:hypothetical protein n=1 Tax=uncultured Paraglaciecola sp. TaxID=1765024 RepID=UPI00262C9891|nr:hypothetical protein [uncultured Paraglaciecola sp.]